MWDFYQTSATQLWLWFIGAFVLGGALTYGAMRAGQLKGSHRLQVERNTIRRDEAEDPQKAQRAR
ncbi:hypothetical protein X566_20930 [Afipia sp. P52-10]|jgi:hypothetical protein|uniref:hypothetical protein n=1 Tax=Afipia sp. P52-10 TaxID=1429916 RepID=UPI0003DF3270|nr:hypothetical protein [Afipia sp. P52-10]ETR75197.1 hypothetical protein X566_20930 [Afipia sp. P52-10]